MVKLANAASNPEAMMIKFADASIALPAMTTAEGLHYLASLAESPFG